jgi:Flp pilus assembly pilin Flp
MYRNGRNSAGLFPGDWRGRISAEKQKYLRSQINRRRNHMFPTGRKPSSFRAATRGAGLVEYGVVVGLVAVTTIGAVLATGEEVDAVFDTSGGELEIARLMASAERRITLRDGTRFPAQSCLTGTSSAETVNSGDGGAGDVNDCYDMAGGGDSLYLNSGPDRNILTYVAPGANQTFLPGGNHLIMFGNGGTGRDQITFTSGAAHFNASQFALADLDITPQDERLRVETAGAGVDLLELFVEGAPVQRFHFSDVTLNFAQMKDYAVSSQATIGNDTITGTALDDVIAPLAGSDTVIPFGGDDRIVYDQGDMYLIGGAPNAAGFDTLDLTKYTASEVSVINSFGTLEVTTPGGTIQIYNAYGSPSNIERIEYSDGALDYADFPPP